MSHTRMPEGIARGCTLGCVMYNAHNQQDHHTTPQPRRGTP